MARLGKAWEPGLKLSSIEDASLMCYVYVDFEVCVWPVGVTEQCSSQLGNAGLALTWWPVSANRRQDASGEVSLRPSPSNTSVAKCGLQQYWTRTPFVQHLPPGVGQVEYECGWSGLVFFFGDGFQGRHEN